MEGGVSGVLGQNVMLIVELESNLAKGTAQTHFQLKLANHVKERGKDQEIVIKGHVQVSSITFAITQP